MQSTKKIIQEPSIRVEIATDEELKNIVEIINKLKNILNQESIMLEITEANIYFK